MRYLLFLAVSVTLFESALAQEKSDPDIKKLQGTWEVAGKAMSGEKGPPKIVITENKLTILGSSLTFTVDSSKKPKWLNLTRKDKNGKLLEIPSIYEVTADELKMCIPPIPKEGKPELKRPEGFETKGIPVLLFKRSKNPG